MNFNNWEILKELREKFLDTVEMALVLGKNGDNALLSTNDGRVYGVGENTCGCLGLGDSSSYGLPSEMMLSKKGMKGLALGGDDPDKIFLVAHLDSEEIFWWGFVPFLNNCVKVIATPQKINIESKIRVKTVACGAFHCAVLSDDGKVFTCGQNNSGQLGHAVSSQQLINIYNSHGTYTNQCYINGTSTLGRVKGIIEDHTVIDVSCGYDFTIVLLENGRVAAWGGNGYGQLGINKNGGSSKSPVELVSLSTYYEAVIEKIVCGKYHVLALSQTGTLFAWGDCSLGQIGIPSLPNRKKGCPLEVKVDDLRFKDIGASHLCNISIAQCENGKIYFWGESTKGSVPKPTEAVECKSINDVFMSLVTPKIMAHPIKRLENSWKEFNVLESTQGMTLMDALKNQFNNTDSSDLTIVVEKKKIHVHQNILKMRSQFFNVLITRWLEKNESVLEIKEKSFVAIEAYLKYLYTDNVEADLNLAVELLQLADEYGDDKLKSVCQNIIQRDMKSDGVAQVFADTRKVENCKNLNKASLEFALRHAKEVIDSPGFESWDANTTKDFVREYVKIKGNCL